jgi:hypothetical protein
MTERIVAPRLADIIEAIERIRRVLDGVTLEAFEQNWEKRWGVLVTLVEAWERKHYPMHIPDSGGGASEWVAASRSLFIATVCKRASSSNAS